MRVSEGLCGEFQKKSSLFGSRFLDSASLYIKEGEIADEYRHIQKSTLASSFLYPVMMSAVRISVLLFYRRLIGAIHQNLQYCIKGLILLTIPYVITYEVLLGLMCTPPSSFWKPFRRNTDCGDVYYYKLHISLYSVSLIFDIIILLLPMKVIWELKLRVRQKIAVCVLIGFGASYAISAQPK